MRHKDPKADRFRLPGRETEDVAIDVDDELTFHIDARTSALIAAGLAPDAAAAQARREFGDVDRARHALRHDGARAARGARLRLRLEEVAHDVRFAARALRKAPVFTAVIVLTLALGIGANAAMLRLLDVLLLRPAPGVAAPDELVRVYGRNGWTALTRAYPDYLDLRDGARSLAAVAAYQTSDATLRAPVRTPVRLQRVTASYFPTLGVAAARGRLLAPDEDRDRGAPVVVLGDRLWRAAFAADPDVIGREVTIGRETYQVVGVAPAEFTGVDVRPVDLWAPLGELRRDRANYAAVNVIARLAPGVDVATADREANQVNRGGYLADGLDADEDRMQLGALALTQGPAAPAEVQVAVWLAAVAALVLLATLANVAHLLLARGLAQAREMAVRAALGAGRARLARQWLTQGLLLGGFGGIAALLAAAWTAPILTGLVLPGMRPTLAGEGVGLASTGLAGGWSTAFEPRLLALTALLTLFVGLACGLVPAVQATRHDLAAALRGHPPMNGGESGGRPRVRSLLLVTQIACTAVLLVGAGLFVRSLLAVRAVDLGFDADRLIAVRILDGDAGLDDSTTARLLARLEGPARAVAGVTAVSGAHTVPYLSGWRTRFYVPGRDPETPGREGGGRFNYISTFVDTAFAEAAGLRLVTGRWLEGRDGADTSPVAVVNETFARQVWPAVTPDESPRAALGQCIRLMEPDAPCTHIVGVVRDTRVESVFDDAPAQYYLPLAQPRRGEAATALIVRVDDDDDAAPVRVAAELQRALQVSAPTELDVVVRPISAAIDPVRRPWELGASVFTLFGLLVLAVSATGLYGLVTLFVAERTPELGVRRALGASRQDVVRLVVGRVLPLVAVGLVIGMTGGWAASRLGVALLYDTPPLDLTVYGAAAGLLALAAGLACIAPVRRALRISPTTAMRAE